MLLAFLPATTPVCGQEVDVGGRAYVDYFYNIEHADDRTDALHGFQYRRLYLTTDFTLSERFSGRARLEAPEGVTGVSGVKVKDLSLTWRYSGEHRATLGVTPPPAFGVSEDVWGYRSLDKTILDFQGIVASRDFGVRLDGPVTDDGTVRYAGMIANNTGTGFTETDPYKRMYGQLSVRPEPLIFVVGADYAGYGDGRDEATRVSGFAGYSTDPIRVGIEPYWYHVAMADGSAETDVGISLFGRVALASDWEVIGRVDRSRERVSGAAPTQYDTFAVAAVAYRPHPSVVLIPNLWVWDLGTAAAETTGRFTVEVDF